MTLEADFLARYSVKVVKQLTNPDVSNATSNDAGRLAAAVTDATQWFEREANVAFDDTDAAHIAVAVPMVFFILSERAGKLGDASERRRTILMEDAKKLRDRTGRDHPTPSTTSILEPSSEDTPGVTDRPDFDSERFNGITPDSPAAP